MEFGWQDVAALGIVLAAVGYLARLAWNAVTRRQGSGCGSGCGSCSSQTSSHSGMRDPMSEQIVSIGMIGPIRKESPLSSLADVVGPLHENFRQSGRTEEEVDTLIKEEVKGVRAERRPRQAR